MKQIIDHNVLTSTYLWVDHLFCNEGSGHINTNARFYKTNEIYNNYFYYTSPYNQFVADSSVSGATIITGLYINNVFVGTGTSGLYQIDYRRGAAVFSTGLPTTATISGIFAIKDFNIAIADDTDENLLFERKHYLKPKIGQQTTGLYPNENLYPIIYIRNENSKNEPLAFGGLDNSNFNLRFTILADSQWNLDAVLGMLRDKTRTYIPIVSENQMPLGVFGGFKSSNYNYTGIVHKKIVNGSGYFIEDYSSSKLFLRYKGDVGVLTENVKVGFVSLNLINTRYPRF